jgi:branched-chain amino acid transport system ATP-binding protein
MRDPGSVVLQLEGVSVSYGRIAAVRKVDITVAQGETVCLLGSNGAGKSSTLNAVVGLIRVAGGHVRFKGRDVTKLPAERRVRLGMALSPEGRRVFGGLTVRENLRLAGWRLSTGEAREQTAELFRLFPVLERKAQAKSGSLSGGEQQQLALGRALLARPELLLLDEPSLGLDPLNTARIFEALETLKAKGLTILLAEQNVARALALADKGYVLESGRISLEGQTHELSPEGIESAYLGITAAVS